MVSLHDCTLLSCLPLSQDKFVSLRRTSEYCSRFIGWSQYQLMLNIDRRLTQLERLSSGGLRGTEAATFADFRAAIQDRPPICALLGHCRNQDEIEFADGFKSLTEVVAAIPEDFDGVLDLSVCRPRDFVRLAKKRASSAVFRTAWTELDGGEWLFFYVTMFVNIGRMGCYGVALLQTMNEFSEARARHAPKKREE